MSGLGFPVKTKKKADSKLTVKIIFQFKYWKSCAQSSGHFRWRPPLSQACGLSLRQQQNVSHYQHFDVFMYIKKKIASALRLRATVISYNGILCLGVMVFQRYFCRGPITSLII